MDPIVVVVIIGGVLVVALGVWLAVRHTRTSRSRQQTQYQPVIQYPPASPQAGPGWEGEGVRFTRASQGQVVPGQPFVPPSSVADVSETLESTTQQSVSQFSEAFESAQSQLDSPQPQQQPEPSVASAPQSVIQPLPSEEELQSPSAPTTPIPTAASPAIPPVMSAPQSQFLAPYTRFTRTTTIPAYNLYFSESVTQVIGAPFTGIPSTLLRSPGPVWGDYVWGWIGPQGPGIDPRTWPRGPKTGLPMRHVITVFLPTPYQRRGQEYPAISYFIGEGQFAQPFKSVGRDDPFVADVRASRDHPQLCRRVDIIGQQFAYMWLTPEEYAAGPMPPLPDSRRPGEHVAQDEGLNAWDPIVRFPHSLAAGAGPVAWVYMTERAGDPNAGYAPHDMAPIDGPGYRNPYAFPGEFTRLWTDSDHLGGSTFAGSGASLPDGMTPYYLELATPTWNYDYGNHESHLIDLESEAFDIC